MCEPVRLHQKTINLDHCSRTALTHESLPVTHSVIIVSYHETQSCQILLFSSSTTWDRSTIHPQVRPNRGSNSQPPDHDSTLHVTETPSLTTRPSVTFGNPSTGSKNYGQKKIFLDHDLHVTLSCNQDMGINHTKFHSNPTIKSNVPGRDFAKYTDCDLDL